MDGIYDQERNERIADQLESFLEAEEQLLIINGKSNKKIKEAKKKVRKMIKNLRDGHPEKVFDEERFDEYEAKGML